MISTVQHYELPPIGAMLKDLDLLRIAGMGTEVLGSPVCGDYFWYVQ
jgi:hypothetical protein